MQARSMIVDELVTDNSTGRASVQPKEITSVEDVVRGLTPKMLAAIDFNHKKEQKARVEGYLKGHLLAEDITEELEEKATEYAVPRGPTAARRTTMPAAESASKRRVSGYSCGGRQKTCNFCSASLHTGSLFPCRFHGMRAVAFLLARPIIELRVTFGKCKKPARRLFSLCWSPPARRPLCNLLLIWWAVASACWSLWTANSRHMRCLSTSNRHPEKFSLLIASWGTPRGSPRSAKHC